MKTTPTREKAQRTFEKRLLAAEQQGTLCNIFENAALGVKMCHHARPAECWSAIYGLLFKAMRYGREHGLISVPDPWKDRSWMSGGPKR
jgi:hypothetical protein